MNWLSNYRLPLKITATLMVTSILALLLSHFGMLILAVCAILAGAAASILISGSVSGRLARISALAEKAAAGQVDTQIEFDSGDEIDKVGIAIKKIAEDHQKLAGVATKLAQGDIGVAIQPRSDQDLMAKALQRCQKNLRSLHAELTQASEAAKEGRLTERCQTEELSGIYANLMESTNHLMDALVQPVGRALKVLNSVSNGDLSARVKGEYRGDHAIFQNALNLTIKTLDNALHQMGMAAEQVAAAAGHISSGSQTLSSGSSEQAGSIEEVSSSLQQVASMTKQNALNAKEASNLSKVAEFSVEAGVESMRRLSDAISRIKTSSDSTAKIIKTIDEIAFQTNLLALNAAVEAARAGDAGKGFAVVAEEVRNLAMRSAEAAKNTANLIEESVKNSENGVALNQEVLKNLNDINEQVRKVGGVMAEIAEASEQQTLGVDQVNVVIQRMSRITQQIASNAEESASGAEELSGQSEELKSMVYAFRLSERNASGTQFSQEIQGNRSARNKPGKIAGSSTAAAKPAAPHPQSIASKAEQLIPFGDANLVDFRDF